MTRVPCQRTGQDVANLVEKICMGMFFADFTVRSPEFIKPSGKQLESADILVPFRDTLLVFQVKSRLDVTHPADRTPVQWARLRRNADKAVDQIKTIKRCIQSLTEPITLHTSRGINIPFNPGAIKHIIGVVIFDVIGEEHLSKDESTTIYRGITRSRDIPTHVFMRHDFEVIAEWVDTVPDFVEYLRKREQLLSLGILADLTSEREYLAAYVLMPKMIEDALSGKCDRLVLDLWEHFQRDETEVQRIKSIMRPGYVVDHIIERQHETIGYNHADIEGIALPNGIAAGTQETYEQIILELASLNRFERIRIGKNLIQVRQNAIEKPTGWCRVLQHQDRSSAIVLLASEKSRANGRYIALLNYVDKMTEKNEVNKVIGIATEAGTHAPKSFDVCMWTRT